MVSDEAISAVDLLDEIRKGEVDELCEQISLEIGARLSMAPAPQ